MNTETWMKENTRSLRGKTVAITGATGGLGREVCAYVLALGGRLILLTRDPQKSEELTQSLRETFPQGEISRIPLELTDMESVKSACEALKALPLDILCLNAGTYYRPRQVCDTGYDIVFQVNFAAQYYMARELLPVLSARHGKISATGSIAYKGVRTNPRDVDFMKEENPEKIYGNSKRRLMFALTELVRENPRVSLSIAHPGITLTGITDNYPPRQLAVVKPSMKVLFMAPKKACRGIVKGMCMELPPLTWLGPKVKGIWGDPVLSPLTGCDSRERTEIYARAEAIYKALI